MIGFTIAARLSLLSVLIALAACGSRTRDVDRLDGALLNEAASGAKRVARHAGPAPRTPRPIAARTIGGCYAALGYKRGWAKRLPAAFALPADAVVGEAAGTDRPGCDTRIVSFATAQAPAGLAEHYRARAARAGYAAQIERRGAEIVVAGEHADGGRAVFVSIVPRRGGGADVDIVSSGVPAGG